MRIVALFGVSGKRGEVHDHLDLLKLDIEGAEYKVLATILEDHIDIRVLCVEFDEFFNPMDADYVERIDKAICQLVESGFVLAHTTGTANYTFVRPTAEFKS